MAERYCLTCKTLRPMGHEVLEHAFSLFGDDTPEKLARESDPVTSKMSARQLSRIRTGSMRLKLLRVFERTTATPEEASIAAGFTPADGAWKRVSDLQRDGFIEDTGSTRTASTGREQRVLRITMAGREALV